MKSFGRIGSAFWTRGSGKRLRGDALAQAVASYLCTSPHASAIGVYFVTLGTIVDETGHPREEVTAALKRIEAAGFAFYDMEAELVWVPNLASYDIGPEMAGAKDPRRVRVVADVKTLGDHPFVRAFWAKYAGPYQLGKYPFDTPSIGSFCSDVTTPIVTDEMRRDVDDDADGVRESPRGGGPRVHPDEPPADIPITQAILDACEMAGARAPTKADVVELLAHARTKGKTSKDWPNELVRWMCRAKAFERSGPKLANSPSSSGSLGQAYASGITAGRGAAYQAPPNVEELLADAFRTHGFDDEGHFPDEDRTDWVAFTAQGFAEWLHKRSGREPDAVKWFSNYGPKGFLKWLNEQATAQVLADDKRPIVLPARAS